MSAPPAWEFGIRRTRPQNPPVGLDCRKSTELRETETPFLEGAHKVLCTPGPKGKSSDYQEPGPDLTAGLAGFPGEAGGSCGSLWRQGHWWQRSQGIFISVSSPGSRHFGTKTWPHPTACRLQCWDASCQTTNRAETQPHLSADRQLKVFLSPQSPLNTPLTGPCPPEGQDPAPPTSGQAMDPPTRKPAQVSRPASATRGQTSEARGTTILQPAEQRLQMQIRTYPGISWLVPGPWAMRGECTAGTHRMSPTEGCFSKTEKHN